VSVGADLAKAAAVVQYLRQRILMQASGFSTEAANSYWWGRELNPVKIASDGTITSPPIVLRRTGLLAASSIVCKRRLGLFGHVVRLANDVPANQILRTCCEAQDAVRPSPNWRRARGRPPTTWIHHTCRDTGISVIDALELAEDRSVWRQIVTAGCYV